MKKVILLFISIIFLSNNLFAQLGAGIPEKFTRKDSLRGTLSPIRNNYDVTFYNLDIKIDLEKKYISGFNEITFLALDNITTIQVDLFENMKLNKVEFENKNLSFKREHNAVFISFNKSIKKGAISKIKIHYEGNDS
jgi:hypothetical protein